ncbi:MAG TPA: uracil-DNA glycosylase [Patescibacteria group bacterium]|nr:uracil-DNA glycosylase [Patescibacteria group bacterium]
MAVGQGAGWQEERDHKPWIGKAGQLLRNILRDIRQENKKEYSICLTNIIRCRPTELIDNRVTDRPPTKEELTHCFKYLLSDIEELKPKIILLMGGSAASAFNFNSSISRIRGKLNIYTINKINYSIMATYHPAGVLRIPSLGMEMRKDILSAFAIVNKKVNI